MRLTKFYRQRLVHQINTSQSTLLLDLNSKKFITYRGSIRIVDYYWNTFLSYGVKEKDRVALVMNNSAELFMIYLTCLLKRIVVCPINPDYKRQDIQFCLDLCKPKIVIGKESTLTNLEFPVHDESNFDLNRVDQHASISFLQHADYRVDDIFSITFTSGSTGKPKGIAHKAETMLDNAEVFNTTTGLGKDQCMIHVMPMFYMAGLLNTIISPVLAGGKVVIDKVFGALSAFSFWNNFFQHQCNTAWLSPTMIQAILRLDRDPEITKPLKENPEKYAIFSGTAPLTNQTEKEFYQTYNLPLQQSYGLSETLIVSVKEKTDFRLNGSVGAVLNGSKLVITDDDEIIIDTKFIMAGYVDEQGNFKRDSEPFITGDLGKVENGELFITGRKKELIIKGGENINPKVIENVLLTLESVKMAAVVGVEDKFYGENIEAYVLPHRTNFDQIKKEINEVCKKNLKASFIPSTIHFVEKMPLTPTGKIKKKDLKH